jgi:hypothetical protein
MSFQTPLMQSDYGQTRPAMHEAFGAVASLHPLVTSVMHGGHAEGSAHYDGRAIDVGAFGGTQVGMNAPTWNALMQAIASERFSRIGTIPELVRNPEAQAFAHAHGVDLFEDVGSGPHVHFQVGWP